MRQVYLVASKSKDTSTKVGAVLVNDRAVISQGFNGLPIGVLETEPKESVSSLGGYGVYVCSQYGYLKSFPDMVAPNIASRFERPKKYLYFEHAERNAIYLAARNGVRTLGSTMYTQGLPCADCSRAIVQSGIKKIILHKQSPSAFMMKDNKDDSFYILREGGVDIEFLDKELGIDSLAAGKIHRV